jgi:hypothetical protein
VVPEETDLVGHQTGQVPESAGERGGPGGVFLVLGILGVLTAATTVLGLVGSLLIPYPSNATPIDIQSVYLANVDLFWLVLGGGLAAAAFGIPFFAGITQLVGGRSPALVSGTSLLFATGFVFVAIDVLFFTGVPYAVSQVPAGSTYSASAAYLGAVAYQLTSDVFNVVMVTFLGLGLVIFAWLSWRSELVPRWLSIVALIGGIGGAVDFPIDPVGEFLTLPALVILGLAIGVRLIRWPSSRVATKPSGS